MAEKDKTPKKRQLLMDRFTTPTKQLAAASLQDTPERNAITAESSSQTSDNTEVTVSVASSSGPDDLGTTTSGPMKPKNLIFPSHFCGKDRKRSFSALWYKTYSWLEYSIGCDAAFCFACRNFSTGTSSKTENAFHGIGFRSWNRASESMQRHDKSADHQMAMLKWENKQKVDCGELMPIENFAQPERNQILAENRLYLEFLIKCHILFAKNEFSYRGHDETEESSYLGNWLETINFMLSTNENFKMLHDSFKAKYKTIDYLSARSSKEFISAITQELQSTIRNEIEASKMFTIMIDEYKDV